MYNTFQTMIVMRTITRTNISTKYCYSVSEEL